MARRIGIARQSAAETIQKLETDGLVRRTRNPDHRRSRLVALTPNGKRLMEELRRQQAEVTHRFTDGMGLSIDSLERLAEQLDALRAHAEGLDAHQPPGEGA